MQRPYLLLFVNGPLCSINLWNRTLCIQFVQFLLQRSMKTFHPFWPWCLYFPTCSIYLFRFVQFKSFVSPCPVAIKWSSYPSPENLFKRSTFHQIHWTNWLLSRLSLAIIWRELTLDRGVCDPFFPYLLKEFHLWRLSDSREDLALLVSLWNLRIFHHSRL